MDSLARDLKLSLRLLSRAPGFSLAAVTLLGLGIGLNTGMFSVLNALVFSPRPFAEPARVMQLYSSDKQHPGSYRAFSYPAYREIASRNDLFDGVLAHNFTLVGVGEGQETRRSFSAIVSSNYFRVLGVTPVRGRAFTSEEGRPGSDLPVVVVSHAFWRRGGFDPQLVGKTIRVNQRSFTVVGIAPERFSGTMMLFGPELYFPFGVFESLTNDFRGEALGTLARADAYNLFVVARLRRDVSRESAAAAVRVLGTNLETAFPAEQRDQLLEIAPLPRMGGSPSPSQEGPLQVLAALLLGLTSCVLLVVCLNLAGLLQARGQARRKELAIRMALGGGRARIVRQLLTEGLVLATTGGALGFVLAAWSTTLLVGSVQSVLPVTLFVDAASAALPAATAGFCVLATLFFALGPALRLSKADVLGDLRRNAGEDPREPRRSRLLPRHPLVAAQLALSLGLLIAAGLFVRMVLQGASVELGFDAGNTVLVEVDSSLADYDEARALGLYRRLEERLAALPGVKSASIAAVAPFGFVDIGKGVRRAGLDEKSPSLNARWNAVGADYFGAFGLPLRRGRGFTPLESGHAGAPPVAIVDEALARNLWPAGNALGQRIQCTGESPELEIVGIAAASRAAALEKEPRGAVFVPFAQGFKSNAHFHVRPLGESEAAAQALVEPVRRELQATAPGLPVFKVRTFRQHMRSSAGLWALRTSATLFSAFAALTMLVAVIGIYGVQAYAVSRRTREIGIRIALGARARDVQALIVREGLITSLAGALVGTGVGAAVGRVLSAVIVDVQAFDAVAFCVAPVLLLAAATLACWIPARRATGIQPLAALRSE